MKAFTENIDVGCKCAGWRIVIVRETSVGRKLQDWFSVIGFQFLVYGF